MVIDGLLSAGHARALLALESEGLIQKTAEKVAAEGLSVRETERLVGESRMQVEPEESKPVRIPRPTPAGLLEVQDRLSNFLATRVTVAMGQRKGKITIEFASVDDLERIFGLISARSPAEEVFTADRP